MSRIERFSLERRGFRGSLPEWTAALRTRLGHVPPSAWDERLTTCRAVGEPRFVGGIEHGDVGEITLARLTTTTPHYFAMAPREPSLPSSPVVLLFQTGGSYRVEQAGRACTLYPGDWCVVDLRRPKRSDVLDPRNEQLFLRLECPPDPETSRLPSDAAARRWSATRGTSRILLRTVAETFDQLNSLTNLGSGGVERAITELVWQAVREQLEAPVTAAHQDLRCAWAKRFIETRLHDSHLSVEAIAEGCGMSVRSLYRAFADDSAGSVSRYILTRRLDHCAAALRDPGQWHRPIIEICFAWGFNSSSHFSHVFKDRFGFTPSEYRAYLEKLGDPA